MRAGPGAGDSDAKSNSIEIIHSSGARGSTRSPELVPRIECCVVVVAGQRHRRRVRAHVPRRRHWPRSARTHTSDPVPAAMSPIKWDSGTRERVHRAARLIQARGFSAARAVQTMCTAAGRQAHVPCRGFPLALVNGGDRIAFGRSVRDERA
jgi:hypothetical protein